MFINYNNHLEYYLDVYFYFINILLISKLNLRHNKNYYNYYIIIN